MKDRICSKQVPGKSTNAAVRWFVPQLIEKVGELNYRARDISLHALVNMFRHPTVDIRILIEGIMDFIEKGAKPEKEPMRTVLARLEILHHLIQEFGINSE